MNDVKAIKVIVTGSGKVICAPPVLCVPRGNTVLVWTLEDPRYRIDGISWNAAGDVPPAFGREQVVFDRVMVVIDSHNVPDGGAECFKYWVAVSRIGSADDSPLEASATDESGTIRNDPS